MSFWLFSSAFSFSQQYFCWNFSFRGGISLPPWYLDQWEGIWSWWRGYFTEFSRKEQDSSPHPPYQGNPGWRFFKVTYAKYENGLKIFRWWEFWLNKLFSWGGVGVWGQRPLHLMIFLTTLHIKTDAHHGVLPHWKMKSPQPKNKPQPLKSEAPFRKWFLEKESEKSETVINLYFTHKITLEKDGRNSTKIWFSHLKHSKFLTRKKLSLMKKLTNINQCLTDIFKI